MKSFSLNKTQQYFLNQKWIYSYWTNLDSMNIQVKKAEYAVRGQVPSKAQIIQNELNKMQALGQTNQFPFDSITELNIGNPQIFGQTPISFNRDVLACMISPGVMDAQNINKDAKNRARYYQNKIGYSIGAYSQSLGFPVIREAVADFIQKRDGTQTKPTLDQIFLTDGASQGIHLMMQSLIQSSNDGVLIPIPQYPLYSACVTLNGASLIGYYLNEDQGWSISNEELELQYNDSVSKGINPKIICIINPGNPTGQLLDEPTIQNIIRFAYDRKIIIFADEVYQENVYVNNKKFHSFRKVMQAMPYPYNNTELFSFHSISKGITGECGFRGGYVDISNMDPQVLNQFLKLKSIALCSNTVGQILTGLMVSPPTAEEGCSNQTIDTHQLECKNLFDSLKRRSQIVNEALNSIKGIHTQQIEGAMYAFPSVDLSDKFITEAKNNGYDQPDLYYCLQALEQTGMVFVPGSGFYQKAGTHHFRTTTLILPEERLYSKFTEFKIWHERFMQKY